MGRNVDIFAGQQASFQSIPGHPRWGLAPIEMAWEGESMSEVCRQIKDPQRNGGRSLELLHEHLAHDDLVKGEPQLARQIMKVQQSCRLLALD